MTLKRDINLCSLLSLILVVATPAAVVAVDLGLTGLLTSQLGVTEPQAMGGAGAIFSYAKEKLSPESFTKVANAVPEMDQLLAAAPAVAAPEPAGSAPGLGALAGQGAETLPGGDAIGGIADKATGLQSLNDSFGKLGMEPDMVGKFGPVVLDYVKSKGVTRSVVFWLEHCRRAPSDRGIPPVKREAPSRMTDRAGNIATTSRHP